MLTRQVCKLCKPSEPPARLGFSQLLAKSLPILRACAVLDLRLWIDTEIQLLFPAVGLLADVLDDRRPNVPPRRHPTVKVVAIRELGFRMQVVLRQRLLVGLQQAGRHRLARVSVEAM